MTTPIPVTSAQIARLRLQTLGLHPHPALPPLRTPLEVIRHHLAMQSQDWPGSRWAIGSRLPGCTDADVLAAYDSGEIVRSWPQRGTVHAVEAVDLHWMLALMGVRALSGVERRWEFLGIGQPVLEQARNVAIQLLQGGKRATREELQVALTDAGLDLSGQRAYHTVWYLSQTGTLVQGPTRDGEQELVLLDEWIANPRRLDRQESLAELGKRYLQARGPVTVDDLVHWSKLSKGDCKKALDAARDGDKVIELARDGRTYLMLRALWEQLDSHDPQVDAGLHALACFDEHLLGYGNRDDVLDPAHATLVDPARNGVFRWTLVHGSRVVATWKRAKKTKKTVVTVEPFAPGWTHADLQGPLQSWGRFAGTPVEIAP